MTKILELYGFSTRDKAITEWQEIAKKTALPICREEMHEIAQE